MNATVTAWGTTFPPMNGSDQDLTENFMTGISISVLLLVIICLVGLAGNAVVLWLLGFRMRRNAVSVYILNLAGADFLFLCCHIVFFLLVLIIYSYHSNTTSTFTYFTPVFTFAYITGLSFLSAISTERCLSVLWPIWYRCHRPRHRSPVMCALIWVVCLLLSVLEGNYCGFFIRDRDEDWCQAFDFIIVGWLIFLFVLLSGSSLAMVSRLLCGSQRVQLTRLYVTVLLTVLVFLLCGMPLGILRFLVLWIKSALYVFSLPLYVVSHVLSCVNSSANPIIYFFVGSFRHQRRKRRQTLTLVLQRALQDFPDGGEHGGSLPQETLEMSGSSLPS